MGEWGSVRARDGEMGGVGKWESGKTFPRTLEPQHLSVKSVKSVAELFSTSLALISSTY